MQISSTFSPSTTLHPPSSSASFAGTSRTAVTPPAQYRTSEIDRHACASMWLQLELTKILGLQEDIDYSEKVYHCRPGQYIK